MRWVMLLALCAGLAAQAEDERPARKGGTFTFTITADSHLDEHTDPALYQRTLANALADVKEDLPAVRVRPRPGPGGRGGRAGGPGVDRSEPGIGGTTP